jgi:hypothetical protein
MSTTYGSSFENLTGQTLGCLRVSQIARRVPNVAWQAQCIRCGSSGIYEHRLLVLNPICKNVGCGRTVPPPSPSVGRTVTISTGVRASESASAREYAQEQQRRQHAVTMQPMTAAALASADPDTLARYIDHKRGKQ